MYDLIIKAPFVLVYPSLVEKLKVNEAIFLEVIHRQISEENARVRNGRKWLKATRNDLVKKLPHLCPRTIGNITSSLCDKKLLIIDKPKGSFNGHTLWYSIDYEEFGKMYEEESKKPSAYKGLGLSTEHNLILIPTLAVKLGATPAMVLQQIHYLISQDTARERNGKRWLVKKQNDFLVPFPFLDVRTIRRAIDELRAKKVIIAHAFDAKDMDKDNDHTLWYSIDYNEVNNLINKDELALNSPYGKNEHIDMAKMSTSLDCSTHDMAKMSTSGDMAKMSTSGDMAKMSTSLMYKDLNMLRTTTADPLASESSVVVFDEYSEISKQLKSMGVNLSSDLLKERIETKGSTYVRTKIAMLEVKIRERRIQNPTAWLSSALKENYQSADEGEPNCPYLANESELRAQLAHEQAWKQRIADYASSASPEVASAAMQMLAKTTVYNAV